MVLLRMPRHPFVRRIRAVLVVCVLYSILSTLKHFSDQQRRNLLGPTAHSEELADFLRGRPVSTLKNTSTDFKLCFLTSVFALDLESADKVGNMTIHRTDNPDFQYILFTNLQNLPSPGWKKVVLSNLPYRRLITQSRWPKFVPWQHEDTLRECRMIIYMDGYTMPINTPEAKRDFLTAAGLVKEHPFGLGQYPKRGSRVRKLAKGLVELGKDTSENVNFTMSWLRNQPDFRETCTVYLNRHILLDPHNHKFQELSSYFWDIYSREEGSWRDQLLWCHAVDKFRANPINLHRDVRPMKYLFEERRDQMGYNGHTYVDPSTKTDVH